MGKIEGSAGLTMFNETVRRAEQYKALMSKSQKLQLAAAKRAAAQHDLFSDWSPLIERVFKAWGV